VPVNKPEFRQMGSKKEKYAVAVIGLGFGQHVHVPAFSNHEKCEVVSVCASNQEKAQQIADKLKIRKGLGDWEQAVSDSAVDIVSIATPPFLQAKIAKAAMKNGKHVFFEKPLGCGYKNSLELLEIAKNSEVKAHESRKDSKSLHLFLDSSSKNEHYAYGHKSQHAKIKRRAGAYPNFETQVQILLFVVLKSQGIQNQSWL